MAPVSLSLLFVFIKLVSTEMGEWDDNFMFSTFLEENHQFKLYWSHSDSDVIDIGIEVNSTGWIAVGLSPNGGMEHSDIMIGWVDDLDGTVILQDRYTGDSQSTPILDEEDNLTLIEGEQEDGITRIRFQRTRSLDCNDSSGHDMAVVQGTSRVIYAWNHNDDDPYSIAYHGTTQRGSQSVNLWYGEATTVELEDDAEYFDLTMTNWSVSSSDTEYVCKLFEMPQSGNTQHIVMIEPLVEEGNEGTVHHIQLYSCPENWVTGTVHDHHQRDCNDWQTNMPSPDCRFGRLQMGWGIGGAPIYYPEAAGLPMSGDSDFHYGFLEIHYDVQCLILLILCRFESCLPVFGYALLIVEPR